MKRRASRLGERLPRRLWIPLLILLPFYSIPLMGQSAPSISTEEPVTYVFVHGAWGGSWDWKEVALMLRAAGHNAYRPSLTGLGERVHLAGRDVDLHTHIQDVVNVLKFEDLTNVVLVGHSYGGMVITGVAEHVPERIAHLVYVDAFVPENGESVADLLPHTTEPLQQLIGNALHEYETGERWRLALPEEIAHPKDVAHPLAALVQPLTLRNPSAAALPGTYILTIEPGAERDDFSHFAERARACGSDYSELPTGHNPQRTMPRELTEILLPIRTEKAGASRTP